MTGDTMLDAHVRGYAQAVRLHLADLGPDVVEDLAGGLEADLADAVADRAPAAADDADDVVLDLTVVFGPPSRYATELRTAAGLPAPVAVARRRGRLRVRTALSVRIARGRQAWARAWEPVTSSPGWHKLRAALVELVPVWWVARGWVLGCWLATAFSGRQLALVPVETSELLVVLAATAVSVQWGRGRWLPWRWMPRLVTVASVGAVIIAAPLIDSTVSRVQHGDGSEWTRGYDAAVADGRAAAAYGSPVSAWDTGSPSGMDGIWVDGMQVSNLFAYDANGDPLRDVQLFDDRGRPVRTVAPDQEWQAWAVPDVDGTWFFRPSLATDGRSRWNVFPLRALTENDLAIDETTGEPRPAVGAKTQQMPWPFLKAPTAIEQSTPTPAPSKDATEDPADDATTAPDPAPEKSPAPTDDANPTPQPSPTPDRATPAALTTADGA